MQIIPDPYRLLGVPRTASDDQIKAAHRRLAKRYHPDAPEADTRRFLAVQEAYQLLSDPLRRREWDARHAAGPVRAGDEGRPRPRPSDGRWTREGTVRGTARRTRGADPAGPDGPVRSADDERAAPGEAATRHRWKGSERDPSARRYYWSANGVPWWEDSPSRAPRRPPGTRRPEDHARSDPRDGDHIAEPDGPRRDRPDAQGAGGAPGAPDTDRPGSRRSGAAANERPATGEPPRHHDFDVYSRSSGAAWSMASRAYFRRFDDELPSRGVFRTQGTQPVTGARARRLADEEAARSRPSGPEGRMGTRAAADAPEPNGHGPRNEPADRTSSPDARARAGAHRTDAWTSRRARSATSQAAPHAPPSLGTHPGPFGLGAAAIRAPTPWPTMVERLAYATVAWVPIALLIGFGGAAATGCDRAAATCPPYLEPLQLTAVTAALVGLFVWPRVAYVAAFATAAAVLTLAGIVFAAGLLGLQPPLPSGVLAALLAILVAVYAITAAWAARDGPRPRPWLLRTGTERGGGP